MSSNQNNNKKMTSIVRRLHSQIVLTKLGSAVGHDFFYAILTALGWILMQEYEAIGKFEADLQRVFIGDGGINTIYYIVRDANGVTIVKASVFPVILFIICVFGIMLFFQLLGILLGAYSDYRKIRKTLKPINDLALRAEELSRISFDESKYQVIEDAIDHIQPDDNTPIELGDAELRGIEAAVNNLLIRLRDAYRQQARFVNDASHELRTPIAVIQGYANMLDRWGRKDEKVLDESIEAIVHEADHMNKLVEQLLFLARGDSGKTTLSFEETALNDLMQETYEESFMIDEEHPYRFRRSEEEITAKVDASMLKQAVRILIDNAAKYTKKGDEIILGVGKTEDGCPYLMVQDTGIGMSETNVEHMFERFYRADEARSFQGTGLGLSIAKWIVDKHQGHFEVLSRTELGTRIRIVLPAESLMKKADE